MALNQQPIVKSEEDAHKNQRGILFEWQTRVQFPLALQKGLFDKGFTSFVIDAADFPNLNAANKDIGQLQKIVYPSPNKSTDNDHQLFNTIKNNLLNNIDNKTNNTKTRNFVKETLEDIRQKISICKSLEYDGLYFIFDKNDINKEVVFEIEFDRKIKLKTPSCVLLEITTQGSNYALQVKLSQTIRLLAFLPEGFKFLKHYFKEGDTINQLFDNALKVKGKINIYPFIVIDGVLQTQHDIFNTFWKYQFYDVLNCFNFYNMTIKVNDSADADQTKPYLTQRIANGFAIDLLHLPNQYDPEQMYATIQNIERKLTRRIIDVEQRLDIVEQRLDKLEKMAYLNMGMTILIGIGVGVLLFRERR